MSESLLDNLLNDSQTDYLKKTCPSLFDGSGKPNLSYNKILSTDQNLVIPDGIKYYEVVETGNNYVDNLLNEEEKYLKEKYGESLYSYFVTKRKDYINEQIKDVCSKVVVETDGKTPTNTSDILINTLRKQLDSYKKSLKTYYEVSDKTEKKTENDFLNARKFYYRSVAMEDTNKMDMMMTIFYYFVLVGCIIYLALKGRIGFKKNWWVYLLLILLPLFTYQIYGFGVQSFHYLQETAAEQGPKKAFMNQT